jgi:hypothetical protein
MGSGRLVGVVCSWTKATELVMFCVLMMSDKTNYSSTTLFWDRKKNIGGMGGSNYTLKDQSLTSHS